MSRNADIRISISENIKSFIEETSQKYENINKLFDTTCKRIASGYGEPVKDKENLFYIKLNDSSPHLDYPITLIVFFSREGKTKDSIPYVSIVVESVIFLDVRNNERTGCKAYMF